MSLSKHNVKHAIETQNKSNESKGMPQHSWVSKLQIFQIYLQNFQIYTWEKGLFLKASQQIAFFYWFSFSYLKKQKQTKTPNTSKPNPRKITTLKKI